MRLAEYSRTLGGMEAYCVRAYGDAMEVIPSTLAENAGLNPISTVTELRNRHAQGDKMAGINVRKVCARHWSHSLTKLPLHLLLELFCILDLFTALSDVKLDRLVFWVYRDTR